MDPDSIIVDLSMSSDDMHGFITRMSMIEDDKEQVAALVGDCWSDGAGTDHYHVTGWWPIYNEDTSPDSFALYQSDVDKAELMTDKSVIGVIHAHTPLQARGPSETDRVGRWDGYLNGVFVVSELGWHICWF